MMACIRLAKFFHNVHNSFYHTIHRSFIVCCCLALTWRQSPPWESSSWTRNLGCCRALARRGSQPWASSSPLRISHLVSPSRACVLRGAEPLLEIDRWPDPPLPVRGALHDCVPYLGCVCGISIAPRKASKLTLACKMAQRPPIPSVVERPRLRGVRRLQLPWLEGVNILSCCPRVAPGPWLRLGNSPRLPLPSGNDSS
jgi:hypothetical protein